MTEIFPWDPAIGPWHSKESVLEQGIETDDLIVMHTTDGDPLYPDGQFDYLPDGSMQRRETVLYLWNAMLKPAVDSGIVDVWTAASVLLAEPSEDGLNEATIVSLEPAQSARIQRDIAKKIIEWQSA